MLLASFPRNKVDVTRWRLSSIQCTFYCITCDITLIPKSGPSLHSTAVAGVLCKCKVRFSLTRRCPQDQRADLEQLTAENGSLRTRLHNVAHSPLSDSEKEQLLLATAVRQHSSAPASMMAAELQGDGTLADTSCSTPDWDKQSSSSLSEVSVACLQDRIMQMEETHYRCVSITADYAIPCKICNLLYLLKGQNFE